MPPYCEEHRMYHVDPTQHYAMRNRARREAQAAALREKAERIARRVIGEDALAGVGYEKYLKYATAAALAALTEKEKNR